MIRDEKEIRSNGYTPCHIFAPGDQPVRCAGYDGDTLQETGPTSFRIFIKYKFTKPRRKYRTRAYARMATIPSGLSKLNLYSFFPIPHLATLSSFYKFRLTNYFVVYKRHAMAHRAESCLRGALYVDIFPNLLYINLVYPHRCLRLTPRLRFEHRLVH